ncbi:MAG TPA: hypothetical protein GX730_06735 [Chloroflexi bacterium]|jgi:hypothetical protein|nr:hypothetical protein [Chloroflexota bacterium]
MTFPTVSGSSLQREKLTLPQDFAGEYNLLFIAFQQWQQDEVNTWINLAESLEARFLGLVYYELPTIRSLNAFSKFFINEGMRAGIPNPKSRERTITLYLDKDDFRAALGLEDEEHIFVLLIDQQGKELWRARGPHNQSSEAGLLEVLGHLKQET